MNRMIFREYDIRGLVDKDLNDETVESIGRAYGTHMRRNKKKVISVGGDCRLSTERFRKALIKGLNKSGCDVINIGICTSPMLYFSIQYLSIDGGIMITGSHNPANFNGFKLCIGDITLHGKDIQTLRMLIENRDYCEGKGMQKDVSILKDYQDYMCNQFCFKNNIKVGIDAGNGTAGEVIIPILKHLGVDVVALYCTMDGNFPNHHPDPTVEKNLTMLQEVVKENKLDIGIAFDGDGDRIGVVDENGKVVWGDKLMILYSRAILKLNPGATIISEVKSSKNLYDDIARHGGKGIMWKTGHSLIKAKMKEENALLAGEMSGHMFFADRYFGFDDAIYAALRLIEILDNTEKKFSDLLSDIPHTYVTPEIRIDCPDEKKFDIVNNVKDLVKDAYTTIDIDGVRIVFEDGWGLIRASNTQPVLVMRFEAHTQKRLEEIKSFIETKIKEIAGEAV